jgi:hypothetical protein
MPVSLYRCDLHRLVLEGVQTMHVTHENMNRNGNGRKYHSRPKHLAAGFDVLLTPQVPGANTTHHEAGCYE